jgi:hypothetical protein
MLGAVKTWFRSLHCPSAGDVAAFVLKLVFPILNASAPRFAGVNKSRSLNLRLSVVRLHLEHRHMDAVLEHRLSEGYAVHSAGEAKLSPFTHERIKMLGRHSFAVPESVARGKCDPGEMRQPLSGSPLHSFPARTLSERAALSPGCYRIRLGSRNTIFVRP